MPTLSYPEYLDLRDSDEWTSRVSTAIEQFELGLRTPRTVKARLSDRPLLVG